MEAIFRWVGRGGSPRRCLGMAFLFPLGIFVPFALAAFLIRSLSVSPTRAIQAASAALSSSDLVLLRIVETDGKR